MSCDLSAQRGDVASSNDEAAVNSVARQSGAAAKSDISPRLGPAPAMESDVEEVAMNALAAFNAGRRRSSTPLVGARASVGFTSVNGRQSQSQTEVVEMQEEVDEVMHPDEDEEEGRDEMVVERQISLAPVVPRVSMVVDGEEVVDMTAGEDVVRRVLEDVTDTNGGVAYRVQFEDESVETVPFEQLIQCENGQEALNDFEGHPPTPPESSLEPPPQPRAKRQKGSIAMRSTRLGQKSVQRPGFVSTVDAVDGSDPDSSCSDTAAAAKPGRRRRKQLQTDYEDQAQDEDEVDVEEESSASNDDLAIRRDTRLRNRPSKAGRSLRSRSQPSEGFDTDDFGSDDDILQSDLHAARPRRSRGPGRRAAGYLDDPRGGKRQRILHRKSGRSTQHQGAMKEADFDDIYRTDSNAPAQPVKPKASGAREAFITLPPNDEFPVRHYQKCEVCGDGPNFGLVIYCQGCTLAYHKSCLGHRTNREHLVTKIGEDNFVLQCRRCVAVPRQKDPTAPDQGKCSECHEHGNACRPFRPRKTPAQEQKEWDDNGGDDPIYEIHPSRINNADNVLFRCIACFRAFHFEHLPSRSNELLGLETGISLEQRFREYSCDWKCKECLTAPAKVGALVAWHPVDEDVYDANQPLNKIDEEQKVYLVKWDGMSYFRATWMPGPWVWGSTSHMMRKAFAKRDEAQRPKWRTEDAIPEDYLRADIVLQINFTSIVDIRAEEVDKARIREISKALIKYRGLGYEDAVWEAPPSPEDGDRWTDFVTAYNDWVMGHYVRPPTAGRLKKRLEKLRQQDFSKLEKHEQPENLVGGQLMQYQIEGLNWLYYKWFSLKNAILADEMGLGKTIQIIGFLATLVQEHGVFPFLIVVPNSTCPNWRREIKRWAPSLRAVAYYGSKESRDLAMQYELYPENSKDLRCNIVITSYDAAADDNCQEFFRRVPWQGLVVDEGQRLKNDKSLLYSALGALKAPFRILLTGTPLQNNQRELFNLLHFLDDSYNAEELEERFDVENLTQEKIKELHDLIRPFFLRRTKAQVLDFLPPMAQIIVPVSMTIVQKKVYRTILAKNPELMKAIFAAPDTNAEGGGKSKHGEKASLNNILMQLRKCLCHPFVYNRSIEERDVGIAATHRNLVDASSKLKLLEILLPALRERGHRVLIFSQFLEMLDIIEDFLDGMSLAYQRLDGSISALQKQKRIDEFNAPNSPLFAFLLSTRAGGVGINLASADTVIILDPDFNPHQDIQALSRAHRIGQTKKVLCFQLVTRASAEERIMQIGRKKLALDHALIQNMDADDAEETDLVSVLRHGAGEIFEDSGEQDIIYDAPSVDRLLDRSHMEDTSSAAADRSAEMSFSFARIWANDQGALRDEMEDAGATVAQQAPDPNVWASILRERERVAAEEAMTKAKAFGRGRRVRGPVDYNDLGGEGGDGVDGMPAVVRTKGKIKSGDESDTDFQAEESDDEPQDGEHRSERDRQDLTFEERQALRDEDAAERDTGKKKAEYPSFRRVLVSTRPQATNPTHGLPTPPGGGATRILPNIENGIHCTACREYHSVGACPLKLAGVEYCNLCGIAHFGSGRVCPHIQSETQVRAMLEALRYSNEAEHLVNEAKRYLRGLKGNLVQLKKQKEAKEHAAREAAKQAQFLAARAQVWWANMAPAPPPGIGAIGGYGGQRFYGSAGAYGVGAGYGNGAGHHGPNTGGGAPPWQAF